MSDLVLGIDLGTTNTVVSIADAGGVRVLPSRDGGFLTPSVVSFHPNGEVVVGQRARERRMLDAMNTVYSTKRLIGRPYDSQEVQSAGGRFPFKLEKSPNGGVLVGCRGETYTLSEISAFVLREVRSAADQSLGEEVRRVVVTVPANFNELQRTATKAAGRVAGLEVIRILNEPTAAALAYGYGRGDRERIAIFDLGGGTFDFTILELAGEVFEVLATAGDTFLGGDDIDRLVAEQMADAFLAHHRFDPRADPQTYERLRVAAEWAKIQLSNQNEVQLRVEELAYGEGGASLDLTFALSRQAFESMAMPLFGRTFDTCEDAFRIAGLRPSQLDQVILVGGSTRIPLVRQMVKEYFGKEPLSTIDPDLVVSQGAAIQGRALATAGMPRKKKTSLAKMQLKKVAVPKSALKKGAPPPVISGAAAVKPRTPSQVSRLPTGTPPDEEFTTEMDRDAVSPPSVPPLTPAKDTGPIPMFDEPAASEAPPPIAPLSGPPPKMEVPDLGAIFDDASLDMDSSAEMPLDIEPGGPDAPFAISPSAAPPAADGNITAPHGAAQFPSIPDLPAMGDIDLPPPGSAPPPDFLPPPGGFGDAAAPPLLLDVTPLSLAVETVSGYCEPIIPRNSAIPTEQMRTFSTGRDLQTDVVVKIAQGESRRLDENQFLGEVGLSGIRPATRGKVKIEVSFILDADGILQVRARDMETGQAAQTNIRLVGGMDEGEMDQMAARLEQQFAQGPVAGDEEQLSANMMQFAQGQHGQPNPYAQYQNQGAPAPYFDANGHPYYLDQNGVPYYLDQNGVPYYLDQNGTPFYIDQNGNAYYIDQSGRPFYLDQNGQPYYPQ